jgi:hypothetical protein
MFLLHDVALERGLGLCEMEGYNYASPYGLLFAPLLLCAFALNSVRVGLPREMAR